MTLDILLLGHWLVGAGDSSAMGSSSYNIGVSPFPVGLPQHSLRLRLLETGLARARAGKSLFATKKKTGEQSRARVSTQEETTRCGAGQSWRRCQHLPGKALLVWGGGQGPLGCPSPTLLCGLLPVPSTVITSSVQPSINLPTVRA